MFKMHYKLTKKCERKWIYWMCAGNPDLAKRTFGPLGTHSKVFLKVGLPALQPSAKSYLRWTRVFRRVGGKSYEAATDIGPLWHHNRAIFCNATPWPKKEKQEGFLSLHGELADGWSSLGGVGKGRFVKRGGLLMSTSPMGWKLYKKKKKNLGKWCRVRF